MVAGLLALSEKSYVEQQKQILYTTLKRNLLARLFI